MDTMTVIEEVNAFGADKVSTYGWRLQDSPGILRQIHKKQLLINDEYQRHASAAKVLELSRNWSWLACGAIIIAYRDGTYWVVDGQHRVLAARKRSDVKELPCLVFDVDDVSEEAQGFLNANTNRKPVTAIAKHHAAVVAGDQMAIKLQRLFDDLGVTLEASNAVRPRQLRCIALARRRAEDDFTLFERVLRVVIDITSAADMGINERLLDGIYYLARFVEDGFENNRLQRRIEDVGARLLLDGANRASSYFAKGGAKVFATGMIEALNKGLQRRFSIRAA